MVGHLVEGGILDHKNVEWIIYDKKHEVDGEYIRGNYDIEGYIDGPWPFSYFSWDTDKLVRDFGIVYK